MNDLNLEISFSQLVTIVKQLSPADKLKLNDTIWNEDIEIPMEQQKLVLQRIKKAKQDPSRMLNWESVSKALKPK
jgi:hypothetical protein